MIYTDPFSIVPCIKYCRGTELISETQLSEKIRTELEDISEFLEYSSLVKILNKLTDYAEILSEGKLSSIINFSYDLSSSQARQIIALLLDIRALTKIYNLALKSTKDLDEEYVSNIFSDTINPDAISSYISIRNVLENRLNHQTQQYNMNMNKTNTTKAMPVNELRGHVKTQQELSSSNVTVSTKAQHGIVAASLHDAYLVILNRGDWYNDRTYMKFFFNEDNNEKREFTLVTREPRTTLQQVERNIESILAAFAEIKDSKLSATNTPPPKAKEPSKEISSDSRAFNDRMMQTPFGIQYGNIITTSLDTIFNPDTSLPEKHEIQKILPELFDIFLNLPVRFTEKDVTHKAATCASYLLFQDYGLKTMAETFLYKDRKIAFSRFYSESHEMLERFVLQLFHALFEQGFANLFRFIKSLDMKQFACAFIIKRIYATRGEDLTPFGYFFIKTIAEAGKIKSAS